VKPDRPDWLLNYFDGDYLQTVLAEIPLERTERQAQSLLPFLPPPDAGPILDLGCGIGRHAIVLSRLGYRVVGLDIVPSFVAAAQAEAQRLNLSAQFQVGDMRALEESSLYAAVLSWWSSFGYFSDEENLATLDGVHRALQPGGLLFLDLENRERILRHFQRDGWKEREGMVILERNHFLPESDTLVTRKIYLSSRGRRTVERRLKLYTQGTIVRMLLSTGFQLERALGGEAGEPYDLESRRMLFFARG
jgi:SAM-dependent methyltransferase